MPIALFTEDKRIIYEQEMSDEKRILGERQGCYDAGHKEGLEQGLEQGFEQGLEQGRTEMILRMIESGMSVEQIAQITRLAPDEIETLIKRHD